MMSRVAPALMTLLLSHRGAAVPGEMVWRTQLSTNASIPTTIVWSSPVVDPERSSVFIGSRDTDLYRLDDRDGHIMCVACALRCRGGAGEPAAAVAGVFSFGRPCGWSWRLGGG